MDFILATKIFYAVIVFLFGITIGSFLNVLIYRIPKKENIVSENSHCMSCNHRLYPIDLVPLFSWIFLGGKCRYCKAKISPQYPIVEAINGIMYALIFWFICGAEPKLSLLGYCAAFSALLVTAVIDWRTMEIPDSMWITVLVGGIIVYIDELIAEGFDWTCLLERVIGFFAASGILFLLAVITKGGMGGGDIKLMAACGFLLGWKVVLLSLVMGGVIGTLYLVFCAVKNKGKVPRKVPFAPHLAAAVVICMFVGTKILEWYFALCGITHVHNHNHAHDTAAMIFSSLASLI